MPATIAPVALVGGWSLAAARQPATYDSARDTISALAAHGATDRWIMTTGLAVLGVCHVATAGLLMAAGRPARLMLAFGGVATVCVAVFAQPSPAHVPAATAGFVALTLWPALWPLPLRALGIAAAAASAGLLIWLGLELGGGGLLGLSERLLAGAQAVCPLVLALSVALRRRPCRERR